MDCRPQEQLRSILGRIDGRGYKAYGDLRGAYDFGDFRLGIDHVQGDPFAAPSRIRLRIDRPRAGFPDSLAANRIRRIALADYLTRQLEAAIRRHVRGKRGSGRSGEVGIDHPGQEVLERTSLLILPGEIEARLTVGLPAAGRRVLARQAEAVFFDELPRLALDALVYRPGDDSPLRNHVQVVEDQQALREQLEERKLVAFVANHSMLPRRSGVDDRPLLAGKGHVAVPFQSPDSMQVQLERPNAGPVTGMGIPPGVTLIVGGGFHGKSTLLRALERGVYNHIPGDGREWALSIDSAVKIRAEDGRSVASVDISPFINNLPYGKDTRSFSTENASGSTSQAANIMESLEAGCRLLLIDEDTSATNFMIRDARMQRLIGKSQEPITPFVDKAATLYRQHGVSTVLVMGGSGDYFDVADQVVAMQEYRPQDVRRQVDRVLSEFPSLRQSEGGRDFGPLPSRIPLTESFDASKGRREVKINPKGLDQILFGRISIDLSALEQLVDSSQTNAIGEAIHYFARHCASSGMTVLEGIQELEEVLDRQGLDALKPFKVGNLARPRRFEIAAAINRMRTLRIQ